jgi:hypothetical protein
MAEQPAAIPPTRLAIRGWPHADRLAARVIPGGPFFSALVLDDRAANSPLSVLTDRGG